jgi:hypothetical protein
MIVEASTIQLFFWWGSNCQHQVQSYPVSTFFPDPDISGNDLRVTGSGMDGIISGYLYFVSVYRLLFR